MAATLTSGLLQLRPHTQPRLLPATRCLFSPRKAAGHRRLIWSANAAAGGSHLGSDENPYQVLGVNPIEGFETVKKTYSKKRRDAEKRGDEESIAKLERAYDKIMLSQLSNRKKGLTVGSFKVSKDIKYADKLPVIPWAPRYSKSSLMDIRINMAISAVFIIWSFLQSHAEWKPLQFLGAVFMYRIFEKLKANEPAETPVYSEDGQVYEDDSRMLRMGKRLVRSVFLVLCSIGIASFAYTGILNLIEFMGQYIPRYLFQNQELFVTISSAASLYVMASYYK